MNDLTVQSPSIERVGDDELIVSVDIVGGDVGGDHVESIVWGAMQAVAAFDDLMLGLVAGGDCDVAYRPWLPVRDRLAYAHRPVGVVTTRCPWTWDEPEPELDEPEPELNWFHRPVAS